MGFPTWTLWGMGLSILGALIALSMAFLALSRRFMARPGVTGHQLQVQVRTLMGLAFALLLLAGGFFLAGVPLGSQRMAEAPTAVPSAPTLTPSEQSDPGVRQIAPTLLVTASTTVLSPDDGSGGSRTGAFAGPLPAIATPTSTIGIKATPIPATNTPSPATATRTPPATPTATPTPTDTPTVTPSLTPTNTPTPTMTPTPIEGETAVIDTQGSTLWVRRTPGGLELALLHHGDTVILSTGHAHQGGLLWREVITVSGVRGWVQEQYLDYGEGEG